MKLKEILSNRVVKRCVIVASSLLALSLIVVLYFAFKPCQHKWIDATCDTPKTCSVCEQSEGEPLKHQWKNATCDSAVTCVLCSDTAGTALGHQWRVATCVKAKTCSVCNKTDGNPLGHDWQKATCTNPKTCVVCNKTKGKKANHKWVEATYYKPKTCSVCEATSGLPLTQSEEEDFDYTEDVAECPICGNEADRPQTPYCSSHDCEQTNCPYPAKSDGVGTRGSHCDFHGCQTPKCTNIPIGGSSYCASCQ